MLQTIKLLPVLALLLPLLGRPGVIPASDLGSSGTVAVDGWQGAPPPSGTMTLDVLRERVYRVENQGSAALLVTFEFFPRWSFSIVQLSIPGTGFTQNYVQLWAPLPIPLGPADGVEDFAGPGGATVLVAIPMRETKPIPPEHLGLFQGETVELTWRYFGFYSASGGAMVGKVDESKAAGRVTARYGESL